MTDLHQAGSNFLCLKGHMVKGREACISINMPRHHTMPAAVAASPLQLHNAASRVGTCSPLHLPGAM
jgi:hypothetical protein